MAAIVAAISGGAVFEGGVLANKLVNFVGLDFKDWVHDSVKNDPLALDQHLSFIRSQVFAGALAAFVYSFYFMLVAPPSFISILALACFLLPLFIACFVSRTGRLDLAHLFSAANLTAQVWLVAAFSGGVYSFAVVWLILVPLEGALSTRSHVMIGSAIMAAFAFVTLFAGSYLGVFAPPVAFLSAGSELSLISNSAAALYAFGLSFAAHRTYRSYNNSLQESREHYRLIAQNTSDLITRHGADGQVCFASEASLGLLGCAAKSLQGSGFASVLRSEDMPRFMDAMQSCLTYDRMVSIEFQLPDRVIEHQDGTIVTMAPIWVEMRCQRVMDVEGYAGVVAVTRDISMRKMQDHERANALEAAARANEAKNRFIANMSHELRTPLNVIIGFSEFLHRELLLKSRQPKHAEYSRMIHESGEHLLSVVNDLLDITKIEAGKLDIINEPFEVIHVARGTIESMRIIADQKSIELSLEEAPELPELNGDQRAIKQILLNLLSNACKFTPEFGLVDVVLRQRGDYFQIEVSDNGIGLKEPDRRRLGEAFFQAESSYSRKVVGAGLGLSIVNGLADLHGGFVQIESVYGEGTTITVSLHNPLEDGQGRELVVQDFVTVENMGAVEEGLMLQLPPPRGLRSPAVLGPRT